MAGDTAKRGAYAETEEGEETTLAKRRRLSIARTSPFENDANVNDSDEYDASIVSDSDGGAYDFFSGDPAGTQAADTSAALVAHSVDTYWQWVPLLEVNQIRVIEIERPTTSADTLCCRFRTIPLDKPCPCMALSYTWEPTFSDGSHLTDEIHCDGLPFRVTANLHAGLRRLRQFIYHDDRLSLPNTLWIDAMCIDQNNAMEKIRQVMMMGEIYRHATHLIIWLGEPETLEPPITAIDLANLANMVNSGLYGDEVANIDMINWQLQMQEYFQRLWVIQEIISCRGPHLLLCGPMALQVRNAADILLLELVPSGRKGTLQLVPLCDAFIPSGDTHRTTSLLRNVDRYAVARCANDLDRLYALRGISTDGAALKVDFRKSVEEAYRAFAVRTIEAGLIVPLLTSAARRSPNSIVTRDYVDELSNVPVARLLPSWVPDWRTASSESIQIGPPGASATSPNNFSIRTLPETVFSDLGQISATVEGDGDILVVQGWLCCVNWNHNHGKDSWDDEERQERRVPKRCSVTNSLCFPLGYYNLGEDTAPLLNHRKFCVLPGIPAVFSVQHQNMPNENISAEPFFALVDHIDISPLYCQESPHDVDSRSGRATTRRMSCLTIVPQSLFDPCPHLDIPPLGSRREVIELSPDPVRICLI